jgi:hypothetical protein
LVAPAVGLFQQRQLRERGRRRRRGHRAVGPAYSRDGNRPRPVSLAPA